ncbi:hypothetical protein BVG16_14670 [Paenibacillus selenitireducens]|uniref:NfeD-like C-terminal domain-containing protein n=1 Tax=Paenibacillus selenitireducens TaxID=1324314 RepID=A0A1T2XDJ4_9BACL|nr:NfeD family protein [Paenibacillus selenitireducens]OPA77683.1 hypothetical protein BVG16_14670 [Paenibacillus selenitireducens]
MEVWVIWLIVGGVLLIAEMFSLTFYMLWLALGALVAMIVALIAPTLFVLQAIAGVLAAVLLTIFTKPITRHFRASRGFKDAVDQLVGKKGVVIEPIEPGQNGIVKVGNDLWSATASEDLLKHDEVIVLRRGNTILEVEKWRGE